MRGKSRESGSYHAQRGWFYPGLQRLFRKWMPLLGDEVVRDTWQEIRRVMEEGCGSMRLTIHNEKHRRFVCELMTALDHLHDQDNSYGWVTKLCGASKTASKPGRVALLNWEELRQSIIDRGGPDFTIDALKKAAKRLKLTQTWNNDALEREANACVDPPK